MGAGLGPRLDGESRRAVRTPGIGRSTTAWIQENTAVLTPMPMPSDTTTTAASSGIREIVRRAWRASLTRWSMKDKRTSTSYVLGAGCNVLNVLRARCYVPVPRARDSRLLTDH